jgi:hypothetical protein
MIVLPPLKIGDDASNLVPHSNQMYQRSWILPTLFRQL